VKCNVDMLKLIQVGFCMLNEDGELPPDGGIWQFNFEFCMNHDVYQVESVELLKNSGIDLEKHKKHGIRVEDFGYLLTISGLVANKAITWLTFHSCFDFGYLTKSVITRPLPKGQNEFFKLHKKLFPRSFDVKSLMKYPGIAAAKLRGGLQDIANKLCVERVGMQHQAGSDAFLTVRIFMRLKENFFGGSWDSISEEFQGMMFGLVDTETVQPSALDIQENIYQTTNMALASPADIPMYDPNSPLQQAFGVYPQPAASMYRAARYQLTSRAYCPVPRKSKLLSLVNPETGLSVHQR